MSLADHNTLSSNPNREEILKCKILIVEDDVVTRTMTRQAAVWFSIPLVHERRRDFDHTARECDEDPTLFAGWAHAFGDGNPMHWANYSGPDGSREVQFIFPG